MQAQTVTQNAEIDFRAYSAKAKAVRALTNKGVETLEDYLYQIGGKWGFDVNAEGQPVSIAQTTTMLVHGATHNTQDPEPAEAAEAVEVAEVAEVAEVVEAAPAPVFAAIAQTLATAPATAPAVATKAQRPEANGVKRPGEHTLCGAIWNYLDGLLLATGSAQVATAKQHAAAQGWDSTTIVVQFYRWRKFNGITGRN